MPIDTNNINGPGAGLARGRGTSSNSVGGNTTAPATAPEGKKSSVDNVELSQQAQTISRIETAIKNSPDVDMSKVEAIKAAIQEGRFEINADAIAEKMMSQEDLLG